MDKHCVTKWRNGNAIINTPINYTIYEVNIFVYRIMPDLCKGKKEILEMLRKFTNVKKF